MRISLLILFLAFSINSAFAQAPNISYTSPQIYYTGTAISNLSPVNSGGAVPANTYSQVSTFAGVSANLNSPYCTAVDAAGNVYVPDAGTNKVYKITPAGVVSTFVPTSAGLSHPYGIAIDPSGNIYVADSFKNDIWKIASDGTISIFAGSGTYTSVDGTGLTASFKNPTGLATDAAGNIYVADYDSNLIRKITPGGVVTTLAGSGTAGSANGTGTAASFKGPFALACDGSGNVYVADKNNNLIRMITSAGVVTTLAGSGASGSANGTGTAASFNLPYGISVDAAGSVYVADAGNNLIRLITTGGVVSTFAGSGTYGALDGLGTAAQFSYPTGVTVDGSGNIFVADLSGKIIRKISATGYTINPALSTGLSFASTTGTISGTPTAVNPLTVYTITGYNTAGSSMYNLSITVKSPTDATLTDLVPNTGSLNSTFAPATTTYLINVPNTTSSIAFTPTATDGTAGITLNGSATTSGSQSGAQSLNVGNNTFNFVVTAHDGVTTKTYTVYVVRASAATPPPVISYASPQAYYINLPITNLTPTNSGGTVPTAVFGKVTTLANTGFNGAYSTAVDAAGNIYVADAGNNRIRKITPAGAISTFATALNNPSGLVLDPQGNLYVADGGSNKIKKITPAGVVSDFAGSGTYAYADGTGTAASFKNPTGLAIDAQNNIYVAELDDNLIRKISITGVVTTLAGSGSAGAVNGTGTTASFNAPFSVAVDASGNVYVADKGNNLIRKINAAGVVTTFAGNGAAGYVDGTGTAASFSGPYGVCVDAAGNVYVADSGNSMIRKITPASVVSTLAGSGNYALTDGIGTLADFSYPTGVAADASGNLYVADLNNNAIRKVITTGYAITPGLPAGLNFDVTTGVISGTPTTITAQTIYTITACNAGGNGTATLAITIKSVTDASLSAIVPSTGTLSPVFSSAVSNYIINVPNSTASISISPTTNDLGASQTFNGIALARGVFSSPLALSVGNNTATIVVTAPDHVTQSTYTVYIVRAAASVAAPAISYTTPQVYSVGTAISSLAPANSGGAVPATVYGQVSTFVPASAGLNNPYTVTMDPQGNLYISDYSNNQVRKVTPAGVVSIFAPSSVGFSAAYGVGADLQGNIYVADSGNNRIWKITSTGVASIFAGSGVYGLTDGADVLANFANPSGVFVDAQSNTYIADYDNNAIRKITLNGLVSTLAGTGAAGANNGAGASATFKNPFSVAADASGNVYVADQNNNLIRKITSGGAVSTFAGSGVAGFANGTGTAAKFNGPYGVTTDAAGNVYIADSGNSRIRKITPAGVVTTLAGTGFSYADGIGTAAAFNFPTGLVSDGAGNIYVADLNNKAIRKIVATGYALSPALPAGLSFDQTTGIISGTPTAASPATIYTITACNTGGNSSATVTITVNLLSADATLSALTISSGTLNPTFVAATTAYSASVSNSVSSITLTPTVNQANATLKVNGVTVTSGAASTSLPLIVGPNTITTVVTAQDGTTTKTYTLTVTRAPSSNDDLANLTLNTGTLNPVFASGTTSYTTAVSNATSTISLTPTTSDANATVTVNGTTVASGTTSGNINLAVGTNTINTVVTAQDGVTTKTYTLVITRAPSTNANLANLTISAGTLSPVFASATISYTASVSNAVSSITLTPSSSDATATITVNGTTVASGAASGSLPLVVGSNTVTTVITAQDGVTTKTYTLVITRAPSSNADLSNLSLSSGSLSPTFASSTYSYAALVGNTTSSITCTPTSSDAGASITVNGAAVSSGTASATINLSVGNNIISIVVTAQDGSTIRTYTITVTRALSSDADLTNINLSTGSLSPVFTSGTTAYTAAVGNSFNTITLTPFTSDANATVKVNNITVASGAASAPINLVVGTNTINVTVTAQDGTTLKTYTVTVTRLLSSNADLAAMSISQGSLSPTFVPGTTIYTASVANNISSLTLTPLTSNAFATLTVNGATVASGSASGALNLIVGANTINVVVTAQDGITTKTYTITVTRAASTNALLSGLSVSSGAITPAFASATNAYAQSVGNAVSSITLTPTTADATATITVNGVAVASGSASGAINLAVGLNTINTIVTAQDGTTTKTYTLTITRAPSSNALLTNISLSAGTLSPVFTSGTISYTTSVSNLVSSITLTPTASDATAAITVNGTAVNSGSASGTINLPVGTTTITTIVTAQDGSTIKTYTIAVTRAPSAIATLSNISLSAGTLSPVFATATTSYTASVANAVTSVTLSPTTSDATASVKVNGSTVASGTASAAINLAVGITTITTVVTAQDGISTKTYTVTITRSPSANADLSNIGLSAGTLAPTFAPTTYGYTALVSNATSTIKLTPTASDATASIKVNGSTVASGTASATINLAVGANTITTVVTAQDGSTIKTYTVTVTRAAFVASTNANLAGLVLSAGTLSPTFASGTVSYTASVGNASNSITITPTTSDVNALVTINGTVVASGSASGAVNLSVGPNVVSVFVTAQDGVTTKTYTITITRAPSANAFLSSLSLSAGTLNPVFASGTTVYTASVSNAVSSITLSPVASDPTASITVNGTGVASGAASSAINLPVGNTTITTVVTAQDGSTIKAYTVTVTRATSSNADLSALALSAGTLTPVFASGTINYTASVSNATTGITITPFTADATASIKVNGTAVNSGTASGTLSLSVGTNTISTTVTAQDGISTKTYTITVTRAPSANANLTSIGISAGTLSPVFATATTVYTAAVGNAISSITLSPTSSDATATITVNGAAVGSGNTSSPISLNVGSNTINTVVTAQDGTTIKTYTITLTRAPSANASLASLSLSAGTLTPVFSSGIFTYTATVGNATSSITLTPVTADATATVTVNGTSVASGAASGAVNLVVGNNTLNVVVTAQDGTTIKTYTITVSRAPSANADLANLSLSAGTLAPVFSSSNTSYTASVANTISSITLTPTTSDATATIKINNVIVASGANSAPINLTVGANTITTTVTAQDGTTAKSYTVTVTRAQSGNADLSNIVLSSGSLSPVFAPATTGYNATVSNTTTSITLTPFTSDATATVTVNGAAVASGSASGGINLAVGTNTITIAVTAQNGSTKNYTVSVIRTASANANLASLNSSTGSLTPSFSPGIISYTISVSYPTTTITFTPVTSDATATITVNGVSVASGSASGLINLSTGANTINTVVTAQDGITTKTYTVTVIRSATPPSSDANIASLVLSAGTFNTPFNPAINSYQVNVASSVSSISITPTLSDTRSTFTLNGVPATTGVASAPYNLSPGQPFVLVIGVIAEDGTPNTYTLVITRDVEVLSSDASLFSLSLSSGILNPVFASSTFSYKTTVDNTVTSVKVTPTTTDATATLTVNGTTVISGSPSNAISLTVGPNTITTVVTAQDGSRLTYTIIVTRLPAKMIIPNAFTPNGDGYNDSWNIVGLNDFYPDCTVQVFNRYGQMVFSSRGYSGSWVGTYHGAPLPAGTYYYIINLNNKQGVLSGAVNIIR